MRRVAPIALMLLSAGCSQAPPALPATGEDGWGEPVADDHEPRRKPVVPRSLPIPESQRNAWARASEIASLRAVPGRSQSEHLDGAFDRTVLVSESLAGYGALTLTTHVPAGTLVVQRHHPRGEERTVAYFVMEKLPKGTSKATRDWSFLVVDNRLRVAAAENLQLCGRCHADAPFDGLFGVAIEADDEP